MFPLQGFRDKVSHTGGLKRQTEASSLAGLEARVQNQGVGRMLSFRGPGSSLPTLVPGLPAAWPCGCLPPVSPPPCLCPSPPPSETPVIGWSCCCCCYVASVVSDSVQPHRRQPTRDSPSRNTGMGWHFLLQCMKVKSESEVA